jgi:hypothetical protein
MTLTQEKVDSLFLTAIKTGDLDAVKYLLGDSPVKANLHLQNEVGDAEYCLVVATEYNHFHLFKYFLEETDLKNYRETVWKDNQTDKTKINGFHSRYGDFIDSLNNIYLLAGANGNLEFIQYLVKELPVKNKFDLFSYASLKNHVPVMDYLVQNKLLSDNDIEQFMLIKNNAFGYALSHDNKEAFHYLKDYCHKNHFTNMDSLAFVVYGLEKTLERKNEKSTDFELFDYFFHHPMMKNHQYELLSRKIFQIMAGTFNADFYFTYLEQIEDKKLKKQLVLDSWHYSIRDGGTLDDYPLFKRILEKYHHYFNVQEKEKIFNYLIYDKDREKFHDYMKYDFLTQSIKPDNLLMHAIETIEIEDTFAYIKDILQSSFKKRINLHRADNHFFKKIQKTLTEEQMIELLEAVRLSFPHTDLKPLEKIFKDNQMAMHFINNWKLHDKLAGEIDTTDTNSYESKPTLKI